MPIDAGVRTEVLWGRRIKARRTLLNLTQSQLADLTDLTQVAISQFEHGARVPRDATKLRIAKALGCAVADLFPWEDAQ
jgi:transcriptional regulator with XRE-family HTH domain